MYFSMQILQYFFEDSVKINSDDVCSRPCTSKSRVSSRMRVARLEAWGRVAICLVHSDTVLVSLVVSGTAAFINTSAASHTFVNIHKNMAEDRV